jgi:IS30 family transposase
VIFVTVGKKIDALFLRAQLAEIAEKLNNRPRECLGWKTPNEAWAAIVEQVLH